ncbi:UDP-N-acetyl glucosamine 2-epimerase, partial [bacterium]|nr:UDP-N-acetyl glucosamine 2-epimerase [bacterium]
CGDTMRETAEYFMPRAVELPLPLGVPSNAAFALMTAHRPDNVDDPQTLAGILDGAGRIGMPVVFPVHPRTRKTLKAMAAPPNLILIEPVGYLEMLGLLARAELALTDSGGLQKEALFIGTPCVTLRGETEWPETIELEMNMLTSNPPRADEIAGAARTMLKRAGGETRDRRRGRLAPQIDLQFGPIDVARRITDAIEKI